MFSFKLFMLSAVEFRSTIKSKLIFLYFVVNSIFYSEEYSVALTLHVEDFYYFSLNDF
jgi:hypothetical protein